MSLIAGEKNKLIRINVGCDISSNTGINLIISRPGELAPITVNPTLGLVNIIAGGVELKAGYYVEYRTDSFDGSSDFPVDGNYKRKLEVVYGTTMLLKSITKSFYVNP